jgi:hypothetical protein
MNFSKEIRVLFMTYFVYVNSYWHGKDAKFWGCICQVQPTQSVYRSNEFFT